MLKLFRKFKMIWIHKDVKISAVWFQPAFLSKEERAALAIKKRQEQVEAQRKAIDDARKQQDDFLKKAKESTGKIISDQICS